MTGVFVGAAITGCFFTVVTEGLRTIGGVELAADVVLVLCTIIGVDVASVGIVEVAVCGVDEAMSTVELARASVDVAPTMPMFAAPPPPPAEIVGLLNG